MSQHLHSVPVGILVSVSGSRRRRKFQPNAAFPPIQKEVNLPLRVGLGAVGVLSLLVLGVCMYSVLDAGPAPLIAAVAQPVNLLPNFRPDDPKPAVQARRDERAQTAIAPMPAAPAALPPAKARAAWHDQTAPPSRPTASPLPKTDPAPACSNLGTQITFLHHPPDAFRQAARENKLVLLVHLSGNFEDQAFT